MNRDDDHLAKEVDRSLKHAGMVSLLLAAIKLVGYFYSDSLIVLASALDSLADSTNSFVNFQISRLAREDADKEHPFGHGGFEVTGSLVQGLVIVIFGLNILIEATQNLVSGPNLAIEAEKAQIGIWVLLLSSFGGYIIQRRLGRSLEALEAKSGRSLALVSDHAHYAADVGANIVAAFGLGMAFYLDIPQLDGYFTILASFFFFKAAYPILKKCYRDIMQHEADPALQQVIVDAVTACSDKIAGIHLFRSREFGPVVFVDFHMKLKGDISLREAHEISDQAEGSIRAVVPRADVIIHLDPETEPDEKGWQTSYTLRDPPSTDP